MGRRAPSLRLWSLGWWEPGSKALGMGSRRIEGTCSFRVWGDEHEGVGRRGRTGLRVSYDRHDRASGGAWVRPGTLPIKVALLDLPGHSPMVG